MIHYLTHRLAGFGLAILFAATAAVAQVIPPGPSDLFAAKGPSNVVNTGYDIATYPGNDGCPVEATVWDGPKGGISISGKGRTVAKSWASLSLPTGDILNDPDVVVGKLDPEGGTICAHVVGLANQNGVQRVVY